MARHNRHRRGRTSASGRAHRADPDVVEPVRVDAEAAAIGRIDIAVGSLEELEALLKQTSSTAVRVQLHMDTGMAREGCPVHEWNALIARARQGQRRGKLRVVGLMGHLPLADQADPEANAPAMSYMRQARRAVIGAGFDAPLTHLAATSGTLTDPATHFGIVRLGAGLVGIDPSETVELHGASRLTAPVAHSATVKAGTPVGYGGTYLTARSTNLSVLPLGYADGIPREISPDASVEIHGRRYPVVGRVSMDQIVIDTGADYVSPGTTATVSGPKDGVTPTIRDWAGWAGTIPHHRHQHRITSEKDDRITPHVLVVGGGQNAEHDVSLETAAAIGGRASLPRVRGQHHHHRP